MIELNQVSLEINGNHILEDISFTWNSNETICLLGKNGSGKTSLALLIAGILSPDSGEIKIDGTPLEKVDEVELRKSVGIVFQDPDNQFITQDVESEIAFGLENFNIPEEEMQKIVEETITDFGLVEIRHRNPFILSGGEKQITAIASIVSMNTKFIIFDEVTTFLDNPYQQKIHQIWVSQKGKKGLIIITQNFEEVYYADRLLLMENGKIIFDGRTKEVLDRGIIATDGIILRKLLKKEGIEIERYKRPDDVAGEILKYAYSKKH